MKIICKPRNRSYFCYEYWIRLSVLAVFESEINYAYSRFKTVQESWTRRESQRLVTSTSSTEFLHDQHWFGLALVLHINWALDYWSITLSQVGSVRDV